MVHGLKDIAYNDRLEILRLISLGKRIRGDLIEVFKILTDRENVDKHQFFTVYTFNMQSSERTQIETVEATINSTSTPEFLQSEGDRRVEQTAKQCCYVNFCQYVQEQIG